MSDKFVAKSQIKKITGNDSAFARDTITSILKSIFHEQIMASEIADAAHQSNLHNLLFRITKDKTDLKISLDASTIATLKGLADVNLANVKTEQERERGKLIKRVFDAIDIVKLPVTWQYYIIQSVLYPSSTKSPIDLELQEELKEYVKQEKQAAAEKQSQEVRKIKADADMAEMDVQRNKQHMDDLKK